MSHGKKSPVQTVIGTLCSGSMSATASRICPCFSTRMIHIAACLFGATMTGAAIYGVVGAVVGACAGVVIGAGVTISKSS